MRPCRNKFAMWRSRQKFETKIVVNRQVGNKKSGQTQELHSPLRFHVLQDNAMPVYSQVVNMKTVK